MSHFRKKATADLNLYASFNITVALFQLIAPSSQQHDLEESFFFVYFGVAVNSEEGGDTYGIFEFFNANIVHIFHRNN